MFKEIKEILLADTSLIIDLLEQMDCHNILDRREEIRCALPESMNNTSVRIRKNEFLSVDIFSRHDFDDFEISDIFALVQYIRECRLEEAKKYICAISGIEYKQNTNTYYKSNTIKEVRRFRTKQKKVLVHDILNESYINRYKDYVVEDWIKEGIDAETQRLFEVKINEKYERWVFPIRDEFGQLISTKGRTYVDNYEYKGIFKYIYYPNLGFNDIMYGYYLTKDYIKESGEVVVVEAEKSVMKAWSMGERNFVASGKAGLNGYLIKRLLSMPCKRVVIAYDKDIGMDVIQKDIDALKYYKDVYYVFDDKDLLDKKDAPVDKGAEVWYNLYESRKRGT